MTRSANAKVPLMLRLPESLRQSLEDEAHKNGNSLNAEMIAVLEKHFSSKSDSFKHVSRGNETLLATIAGCFVMAEKSTGGKIYEDITTTLLAIRSAIQILNGFKFSVGEGSSDEFDRLVDARAAQIADMQGVANLEGRVVSELAPPARKEGAQKMKITNE